MSPWEPADGAGLLGPAGEWGEVFDLSGGELCLDLANTLSLQSGDHLPVYPALVAWARQSGVVAADQAARLLAEARRRPAEAEAVLARARALRGVIFRLFSAVARGGRPDPADLEALNAELSTALARARVLATPDGYAWGWDDDPAALDRVLWPVARAAAELLASGERLASVKQCGARDCAWLFLDTSKNRSRQWCDMRVCGNREKARRFQERRRMARLGLLSPPGGPG